MGEGSKGDSGLFVTLDIAVAVGVSIGVYVAELFVAVTLCVSIRVASGTASRELVGDGES